MVRALTVTLILIPAFVFSQTSVDRSGKSVRIYGTVKRPAGTVVAEAAVTLKTVPGGETVATTKTNQKGAFEVFASKPGAYVVTVEVPGYLSRRYGITAVPGNGIALGDTMLEVDVPCPVNTPAASSTEVDQPIRTTLCEILKAQDRFNGKMVQVRAKVYFGFEASLLRDEGHSIWLSTGLPMTMFSPGRHTKPSGPLIALKKDAEYQKMMDYLGRLYKDENGITCEGCPLYEVTVDAVGRFEHVDKITTPPEERHFVGFGHMNGYESQLVLESVSNVIAIPIDASIYKRP